MLTILQKLFLRTDDQQLYRQRLGVLCGGYGIFLNILLFAAKYIVGITTGSIAVTADAFNNLSDAGSSLINMVGFLFSGQKPDPKHPFGHGRIEYISGFTVSVMIIVMGFELGKSSVEKIFRPEPVEFGIVSFLVLLAAILVKLYMALYNFKLGKKINSAAMRATATDSLSDSIATAAVLISGLIGHFLHWQIDGWMGVLVAVFILLAGYGAAKDTISPLLGQAPDPEYIQSIQKIVLSHEMVCGIHDVIVHDYGPGRRIISLHAEVPADENIMKAHDEIDNIENELKSKLQCDASIHLDPIDTHCKELAELKEKITHFAQTLDAKISTHDFRMIQGPTHTNIIFDLVLPSKCALAASEIEEQIESFVYGINPSYRCVITFDTPYV